MDNCVETFSIERFRDLMGVPKGAYQPGKDFVRVLDAAALEVNGLADYGVKIEVTRRHSRSSITAVTVAWWRKEGDEFRATAAELRQSKLGRRARLEAAQAAAVSATPPAKRKVRGAASSAKPGRPGSAEGVQLDIGNAIGRS